MVSDEDETFVTEKEKSCVNELWEIVCMHCYPSINPHQFAELAAKVLSSFDLSYIYLKYREHWKGQPKRPKTGSETTKKKPRNLYSTNYHHPMSYKVKSMP